MTDKPTASRRAFFGKAGAAFAVPLAVGVSHAHGRDASTDAELRQRLARLEDRDAIHALNETLVARLNHGGSNATRELFTTQASISLYPHIDRLAVGHAAAHLGVSRWRGALADTASAEQIDVAEDGLTASATLCCIARLALPIEGDNGTLAAMARLQGTDVIRREQAGKLKARYEKQAGVWKFSDLSFHAT